MDLQFWEGGAECLSVLLKHLPVPSGIAVLENTNQSYLELQAAEKLKQRGQGGSSPIIGVPYNLEVNGMAPELFSCRL